MKESTEKESEDVDRQKEEGERKGRRRHCPGGYGFLLRQERWCSERSRIEFRHRTMREEEVRNKAEKKTVAREKEEEKKMKRTRI